MPIEILMPALSPTMTEGTLAKWLKKEGDTIAPGDVIAEIETDKATMEVESVDEGVMGKILVKDGTDNVPVNRVIALLLEEGEDKKALENYMPAEPEKKEEKVKEEANTPAKHEKTGREVPAPAASSGAGLGGPPPSLKPQLQNVVQMPAKGAAVSGMAGERVKASPLAKRIARERGIDLRMVTGTGPHGRVVRADVEEMVATGSSAIGRVMRSAVEAYSIPLNNMRKTIARRLTESKQWVPHFYLSADCELDKLLDARKDMNAAAEASAAEGASLAYKLSVNDLIIRAVALALKKVPEANASWNEDAILQYNNVDVSVAVAIDGGLITPVIRNADQKTLPQISNEMKDLARRAREGKLVPEEYSGGGFSISNLGMYGIKEFAAIINPPQSCILAVGAGEERAVVKNGVLTKATVMTVTLSVDHRVVDGAIGANFLAAFKGYVESPITMFM